MDDHGFDPLKLENQLCFPLYACAREIIKRYTPYLDALGLTYTQYIAMMILWEERAVTVKDMGRRLYLDSGTLTPLLKKLESKGFVTRTRSRSDERSLVVAITPQGEALRERALEVPAQMARCTNLEPREAAELYRILYKLLGQEREEARDGDSDI